jgi:hypothetical protein
MTIIPAKPLKMISISNWAAFNSGPKGYKTGGNALVKHGKSSDQKRRYDL